jgi:hypothetical protein
MPSGWLVGSIVERKGSLRLLAKLPISATLRKFGAKVVAEFEINPARRSREAGGVIQTVRK